MGFEGAPKRKGPEKTPDPLAETASILEQLRERESKIETAEPIKEGSVSGDLSPEASAELNKTLRSLRERE